MARKKRVHASPMRPEIQGALWVAGLYGRLSVLDNGKVDGEPIKPDRHHRAVCRRSSGIEDRRAVYRQRLYWDKF